MAIPPATKPRKKSLARLPATARDFASVPTQSNPAPPPPKRRKDLTPLTMLERDEATPATIFPKLWMTKVKVLMTLTTNDRIASQSAWKVFLIQFIVASAA